MKYATPLPEPLIDELFPFWTAIFGEAAWDVERAVFLGAEAATSRSTLYLQRAGTELAGTCFMMQSTTVPALAGMGEVATVPQFRGQGIASDLCCQALADFRAAGGEAFFLGTVNPAAARIYHRLGWRKLAGANLMVNLTSGVSPEECLVEYFRQPGQVTSGLAGPDVRVPMIPLILSPHDSPVLDANVGLYSCRYQTQNSCMGLYPRYTRALDNGTGAFFAARTTDGRVVGLATARHIDDDPGECVYQIDGFVHHRFAPAWPDLIKAACEWARTQEATALRAQIGTEDGAKQAVFQALGFAHTGIGEALHDQRMTIWHITKG